MPESPRQPRLLVLAAALLFSTGGAAIKAASLNGWQIASMRSGIAALFLFAAIPESRQWSLRLVPVAACYAAMLISFVLANRLTTAAHAIFLQSAAPVYVLLLGPLLLHEPVRRRDLVSVGMVVVGIGCLFVGSPPSASTAPDPARGNIVAAVSGLAYALMLVGLRWLARKESGGAAISTVALGNLVACLAALPVALPMPSLGPANLLVLLYLGTIQVGLAYLCLTRGMRRISAVQATMLLMAEPALNPLWTWLVLGEWPGPWAIAGGILTVSAPLLNLWRPGEMR
jgi:drug/metabolite transporter (DMT)-like permease